MDERTEHEQFEQLLSGRSGFAEGELAKLASLARALERTRPAPAAPRSEFREALRTKLLEESRTAVVIPLPLYARIRASIAVRDAKMRRSFRLVVATAAAVMMLLVSGAAFAASSDSLPGQALYPMKRAREGMQLAFTFGALPKAQKQLGFARERLDEVRALADAGELDTSRYISTLKDMDARTADPTSQPTSAPSPTPTPTTSPSPSPSPSPGPVEQVQDAVNQLLNGLLPTPTPLPSTPALP